MNAAATAHALFVEKRRTYIGGTDASAILGLSPWATPLSVYLDKVGQPAERRETLAMRRGIWNERFIADEFERARPGFVCYQPKPAIRTDVGFPMGASIDRMVATVEHPRTPVAILEAKTAFTYTGKRQWDADNLDLPDHYFIQVQHYLAVTGLPLAYGVADVGDPEALTIVPIEADKRVQQRIIEAEREFWQNHVLMGVAPEPNGSDADHEALAALWPDTIPDPPLAIEDELSEVILSDYLAHSLKAKQHGEEAEKAKQRLQALMGEHEAAVVGGWKLTWKPVTSNRIDSKALKAEQPEIAAKYTKPSVSRRFEVKEMGG